MLMIMDNYVKRSWVEIDQNILKNNCRIYKRITDKNQRIMAVIKADAYGHGDISVAKALFEEGITDFAVSNIDEACRLRELGINGEILILGYTPIDLLPQVVKYNIMQTIISEEYAEEVCKSNVDIKCQIALDTGMNRIGLNADDVDYCIEIIRKYSKKLNVKGIFTHLCVADSKQVDLIRFTENQIEKFDTIASALSDLKFDYVHCLNSAGGLWHKSKTNMFIRLGIVLYGLKPDYLNVLPDGISTVLEWKSVVSMVKTVYKGETIGYGRTFMAEHEMKIATIPTGYADGYNRLLSNKGYVLINGRRANIVGRICMDQMMVDVTNINDVSMGTEVVLLGRSGNELLTADDMAQIIDTIGYEIVCNISKRVPRVYI
mgnify:CR=1 FL=1